METKGELGSYEAEFMQSYEFDPSKTWKKGKVKNIHRNKRGVWDILYCALHSIGMNKRNKNIIGEI
jgi:hypothetical protein